MFHVRHVTMYLSILGLCVCGGCQDLGVGNSEANVREIAKSWPPYRAPVVAGPIEDLQIAAPGRGTAPLAISTSSAAPPIAAPAAIVLTPPVRPVEQWGLPETAVDSLGRIGAPAVPALIQAMENSNPARRVQAANVLARIGPAARQAVPRLVEALQDRDPLVQKAAARALGQIGPAAEQAVEPLLNLIEDEPR